MSKKASKFLAAVTLSAGITGLAAAPAHAAPTPATAAAGSGSSSGSGQILAVPLGILLTALCGPYDPSSIPSPVIPCNSPYSSGSA